MLKRTWELCNFQKGLYFLSKLCMEIYIINYKPLWVEIIPLLHFFFWLKKVNQNETKHRYILHLKEHISLYKLSPLEKYKICYCVLLNVSYISLVIYFLFLMTMVCQNYQVKKKKYWFLIRELQTILILTCFGYIACICCLHSMLRDCWVPCLK